MKKTTRVEIRRQIRLIRRSAILFRNKKKKQTYYRMLG
jgi:hypothetical protein